MADVVQDSSEECGEQRNAHVKDHSLGLRLILTCKELSLDRVLLL